MCLKVIHWFQRNINEKISDKVIEKFKTIKLNFNYDAVLSAGCLVQINYAEFMNFEFNDDELNTKNSMTISKEDC